MKIDTESGFTKTQLLATENHKIFSILLLNCADKELNISQRQDDQTIPTLLLGCNRGFIFKFEKRAGELEWSKTAECRVDQSVSSLLQVAQDTVLAVQEEGNFDFIDVTSMS